jgi:hypothetical protein
MYRADEKWIQNLVENLEGKGELGRFADGCGEISVH